MVSGRTPYFLKKIYYSLIWDLHNREKELYLTFDDGPTPEITLKILDILDSYNARATFFCLGRNVERYHDIYKEILNRNHAVGNHTYSHLKGWKTKTKEYYDDIELAGKFIKSTLFRPPYGKIKRTQLKYLRHSYKIIMWDIMSYDFKTNVSKEKCLSIVLKNVRPGSIIVFHDSPKASENMLYAVPRLLEYFMREDYKFNSIADKMIYNSRFLKEHAEY
jgi:peptidoglycan/xylan/chitin deacetylase (PgdA/CDA1 family)